MVLGVPHLHGIRVTLINGVALVRKGHILLFITMLCLLLRLWGDRTMVDVPDEDHHLAANLDSQSLIAYRLGRVEKAVEANNASAVERDSNIVSKLEILTTLSTQLATTAVRLDNLEGWKRNITTFLVALTISMVGLVGTVIIRSME